MGSLGFFIDCGPGVDSASNRNEYQGYLLRVKATGAYGRQPYHLHVPGPVQASNGIALPLPLEYSRRDSDGMCAACTQDPGCLDKNFTNTDIGVDRIVK